MFDTIKKIAQENPQGFTFNIFTQSHVRFGITVAYAATQNHFNDEDLHKVIAHAQAHAGIIGGWYNSENGAYYYDSCKLFASHTEAMQFARENEQIAFYDLTNLKEIKVE